MTARRVVTLPPGFGSADALAFARTARMRGADLLELRTDLHASVDAAALARVLPLLIAEREGRAAPPEWREHAALYDVPLGSHVRASLVSFHADRPLTPAEALAVWEPVAPGAFAIKHVEPLGAPKDAARLFETQRLLSARYGSATVLAMGDCALPFRAVLAEHNALDYLALDAHFAAAPGQRLLDDAVRAARGSGPRLGILGSGIAHSRSPRIHPPPFDRIDLPADAPLGELLDALHPHYRGFAVTAPFKRAAARHVGAGLDAVNTLVRTASGWSSANTDVDGAAAVLTALNAPRVTVLGAGGASVAVQRAGEKLRLHIEVAARDALFGRTLSGTCLWTWPGQVEPPAGLRFSAARVAVIAYGPPAQAIRRRIEAMGGEAMNMGPRWFIAQARAQRTLWEAAR